MGLAVAFAASSPALAQSETPTVDLTIAAGRPLRVALDATVRVTGLGQAISASLVDPVYSYDRIVLPAGTPVTGHVAELTDQSKLTRVRAWAAGNFSPPRHVVIVLDALVVDGRRVPIDALATNGAERVRRQVAARSDPPASEGRAAKTERAVKEQVGEEVARLKQAEHDALAAIKEPGKSDRVKQTLISKLPYHPQYLNQGTVYSAVTRSAIPFDPVPSTPLAPPGAMPAPDSVLTARLTTPLDSSKTPRGTTVTAVIDKPVFSENHELILAEGSTLEGEVTFAKPPQHWHRNGELRFLIERARAGSAQESTAMLASLYSVDVSADTRIALDDEGGAAVKNTKTRFIAPALAVMALHGSMDQDHHHLDNDGDPYDLGKVPAPPTSGHWGARGIGGFIGFGFLGVGLSQISRPLAVAFAAVGAARTTYKNIVGKGDDVTFAADTPIQVRLAPGKSGEQ
jgi:hypothetical protein